MKPRMVYLIGVPGAGKSTLMRAITAPLGKATVPEPFPHTALYAGPRGAKIHAAELGIRREAFSGTDALAMSVQPQVLAFLEQHPYPIVLGEGDRLANDKFFTAVQGMGYDLHVVHVATAPSVVAARRAGRTEQQDARWLRGRETKVARLAATWARATTDGTLPPMTQLANLRSLPGVGRVVNDLYLER